VIEGCAAAEETATLHDTTVVKLEHDTGGINSNGDWSLVEGSLEGGTGRGLNINEGGNLDLLLGLVGGALAISTSVGIVRLGFEAIVFNVLEGIIHETTIATLVALSGGAVNELLLRKRDELSSLDLVGTLKGSSGGEGPA
jgi:hypothetical protein